MNVERGVWREAQLKPERSGWCPGEGQPRRASSIAYRVPPLPNVPLSLNRYFRDCPTAFDPVPCLFLPDKRTSIGTVGMFKGHEQTSAVGTIADKISDGRYTLSQRSRAISRTIVVELLPTQRRQSLYELLARVPSAERACTMSRWLRPLRPYL